MGKALEEEEAEYEGLVERGKVVMKWVGGSVGEDSGGGVWFKNWSGRRWQDSEWLAGSDGKWGENKEKRTEKVRNERWCY